MSNQNLEKQRRAIINEVVNIEGGYVNDPKDSGGETKYGITKAVAQKNGFNVRALTIENAYEIYEKDYWHSLYLDEVLKLAPALAEEIFDSGVNVGPSLAATWLQRSLNVQNQNGTFYPDIDLDGDIGPQTIGALSVYLKRRGKRGETVLLNMLNALQQVHYMEIAEKHPKNERFSYGWSSNRVQLKTIDEAQSEPVPNALVNTAAFAELEQSKPKGKIKAPREYEPERKNPPALSKVNGYKTYAIMFVGAGLAVAQAVGYPVPEWVYVLLGFLGFGSVRQGIKTDIKKATNEM